VWNSLRAAIPDPDDSVSGRQQSFRLADLDPGDARHEVEFLMPFPAPFPSNGITDGNEADDVAPLEGVEGIQRRGSFLWGFIDLVFRRDGRYYLLDWKSNLLPSYDAASVERSMEKHRYHLQWKLYAVALDRWLAARLPDYDPEKHFGGVCYLYLRGASATDGFSGYITRPTRSDLREAYPLEISALLASGGADGAKMDEREDA
jgi:exodeoxyribonuclease V beta subunit